MAERTDETQLQDDPLWYKDAVIYEVPVRAFLDSSGDGVGDFGGLTQKLGYIQELGVTALWILPFYPSPLRDDGYDISDYMDVHRLYGTLRDFKVFLREAHRRGLRVIIELVLNHTSDQHPWFQRARRAKPGSSSRDFYVWANTPDGYKDARIIFKDFENSNWAWDPVAKTYFWHRFYSHQPDLNFQNSRVRKAIQDVVDFWLGLGVDGLRLDAVPYLYEREGTSCENLPETHSFLKELRAHVDAKYRNRMLLAEANQWPEDAAEYFGKGDECHMAFHFPLMPRLFMALRMEDRFPVVEILNQTPPIPPAAQWALFLRNHDELTLEMVTDEERDYIYRMYARDPQARVNLGIRRRLAPLLENDRRRIELMTGLLLSLPGTPVLYYGDEIGMGDNFYLGDRNGVRTPMQWSADRNAGFSTANPQQLNLPVIIDPTYHYEAVNVETQRANPNSLLWWTQRLIERRKAHKAFGRGTLEFLYPENRKVLAYIRRYETEAILVVANLSRHPQSAELDLRGFSGSVPVELAGGTRFPAIGGASYILTLGSYGFYWFSLEAPAQPSGENLAALAPGLPRIVVFGRWQDALQGHQYETLQPALAQYLRERRWFGGKGRAIFSLKIEDLIPVPDLEDEAFLAFLRVEYMEGEGETYVLPLGFLPGDANPPFLKETPDAAIARLATETGPGILYDAFWDPRFLKATLASVVRHRRWKGSRGEVASSTTRVLRAALGENANGLEAFPLKSEQTNTSAFFGDRLMLKLLRRFDPGPNPELELSWFLTERTHFAHAPALAGALHYGPEMGEPGILAILLEYVRNEGDAWHYTLDVLGHYYERARSETKIPETSNLAGKSLLDLAETSPPPSVRDAIGPYLEQTSILGQTTADLHRALADAGDDPDFVPEPFNLFYQKAMFHSMVSLTDQVFTRLRHRLPSIPGPTRTAAAQVLDLEGEVRKRFGTLRDHTIEAVRIRCHGDYHLGQVLYTGKDFVIIDFEGEPARPITERRIKRSPVRDVAGMMRSFHYASRVALDAQAASAPDVQAKLEPWATQWYTWCASRFLRAYLEGAASSGLLPKSRPSLQLLLDVFLLEKSIYEIGYELDARPPWLGIPLRGILELLGPRG